METTKLALDVVAAGITVGALLGLLPPLAAVMSICWLAIQMYDRFTRGPK